MPETIYILGVWRVKPEYEADFIAAWKAARCDLFSATGSTSGKGTLIQSLAVPILFYSFGPRPSQEAVQAMRNEPQAQAGINRLREPCTEAISGSFRLVAETSP